MENEGFMREYPRMGWKAWVQRHPEGGWSFHEDNGGGWSDINTRPMSKRRAIRMWRNSWYTIMSRRWTRKDSKGR